MCSEHVFLPGVFKCVTPLMLIVQLGLLQPSVMGINFNLNPCDDRMVNTNTHMRHLSTPMSQVRQISYLSDNLFCWAHFLNPGFHQVVLHVSQLYSEFSVQTQIYPKPNASFPGETKASSLPTWVSASRARESTVVYFSFFF